MAQTIAPINSRKSPDPCIVWAPSKIAVGITGIGTPASCTSVLTPRIQAARCVSIVASSIIAVSAICGRSYHVRSRSSIPAGSCRSFRRRETPLSGRQPLLLGEFLARGKHRRSMLHGPVVERSKRHHQIPAELRELVVHTRRDRRKHRTRDEAVALELLQRQREHALGDTFDGAPDLVV